MANAHSHAFHRALRGRVNGGGGNFWSWREQMYAAAEQLNPDTYFALARAVFAEMVQAGITVVGEFHYVHHRPGGHPYGDPNAMGAALIAMIIGQILAGIAVDPVTSVIFTLISISGILFGIVTLRNIRD